MRVAVTGSSGMIGTAVVRALIRRGDGVTRIVRPGSRAPGIYWDPRTRQIHRDRLEGIDAVVHLAGASVIGVWTDARKRQIRESRVRGTSLLANTLAQLSRPPRVLVCASGISYYGNRPDGQPVDETAPKGAGFLADVVAAWEAAAEPARAAGIRVAQARFGLVLSKEGGTLKVMLPIFYMGLGGRLGSGRQIWSWVTLEDVVGTILHLIDGPVSGPTNVTAPNPVSNAEFTRALGAAVHRPTLLAVPDFLLRMGGGPARELALSGAWVSPRKLLESGYVFRYPELRGALQAVLAREVGT